MKNVEKLYGFECASEDYYNRPPTVEELRKYEEQRAEEEKEKLLPGYCCFMNGDICYPNGK